MFALKAVMVGTGVTGFMISYVVRDCDAECVQCKLNVICRCHGLSPLDG